MWTIKDVDDDDDECQKLLQDKMENTKVLLHYYHKVVKGIE